MSIQTPDVSDATQLHPMNTATHTLENGRLLTPRYVVCLVVLIAGALGYRVMLRSLDMHLTKAAVPLKKPFYSADWTAMEPRYQQHPNPPRRPSEEELDQLGTKEFLLWGLVDSTKDKSDRDSVAIIAVTYYTGAPDVVPHVPEECMSANGYDQVGASEEIEIEVPGIGAPDDKFKVRVATFDAPLTAAAAGQREQAVVMYFFHCNGDYCNSRRDVRMRFMDPRERYAYFSKIEIKFTNWDSSLYADKATSIAALPPLLARLMPMLINDHYQWAELHATDSSRS
ncbi:MAG: hypothetical protein AB7N71_07390 [Phycisphaerae bacterium]